MSLCILQWFTHIYSQEKTSKENGSTSSRKQGQPQRNVKLLIDRYELEQTGKMRDPFRDDSRYYPRWEASPHYSTMEHKQPTTINRHDNTEHDA